MMCAYSLERYGLTLVRLARDGCRHAERSRLHYPLVSLTFIYTVCSIMLKRHFPLSL